MNTFSPGTRNGFSDWSIGWTISWLQSTISWLQSAMGGVLGLLISRIVGTRNNPYLDYG